MVWGRCSHQSSKKSRIRKEIEFFLSLFLHRKILWKVPEDKSLYSMKIKEQTRKLAAGCSKHCFEVVDKTDKVRNIYLRQGNADVV